MREYILHMKNHAGWHTQFIIAESVMNAITQGLDCRASFLSQKYAGKYKIEHDDPQSERPQFYVKWDSDQPKSFSYGQPLNRGDLWWSDQFRIGSLDDCQSCGGTGVNHYNPFNQCWGCGDKNKEGRGSGGRSVLIAAKDQPNE